MNDLTTIKSIASNVNKGNNPSFAIEDFFIMFPQFRTLDIPVAILDMYLQFANSCVKYKLWKGQWKLGMSLFIAHFLTLYLQSALPEDTPLQQVLNQAQTRGLMSSKSVGELSVSYDFSMALDGLERWGLWKTTNFGVQFISMAKLISKGGMLVW